MNRGATLTTVRGREAGKVGKEAAERLLKKGIKKIIFDRGVYKYHGQVKSLAEAARTAGLEF